jgi:hypothetical protein
VEYKELHRFNKENEEEEEEEEEESCSRRWKRDGSEGRGSDLLMIENSNCSFG